MIWALHRPSLAEKFDHILVMRNGKVVEQGSYTDLNRDNTEFHGMLAAE